MGDLNIGADGINEIREHLKDFEEGAARIAPVWRGIRKSKSVGAIKSFMVEGEYVPGTGVATAIDDATTMAIDALDDLYDVYTCHGTGNGKGRCLNVPFDDDTDFSEAHGGKP